MSSLPTDISQPAVIAKTPEDEVIRAVKQAPYLQVPEIR
jgi:hypothetical protein